MAPKSPLVLLKSEGMRGYVAFDDEHRPCTFVVEPDEKTALESAQKARPEVKQVVDALDAPLDDLRRIYYISMIQLAGLQMAMVQAQSRRIQFPQ